MVSRPAWRAGASEKGTLGRSSPKGLPRFLSVERRPRGRPVYLLRARGRRALAAARPLTESHTNNERRNMLRRNLVGIVVLALAGAVTVGAQVKEMPRTAVKPVNQPSIVDINAAPEADIVSIGIERAVAKKIVEGRPWRSKRDLVTKQVLTKDQYEKFKNSIVAKRPKKS